MGQRACIVMKFGGELLERPEDVHRMAAGIRALAARAPLVVVHGGGREIDAGLAAAAGQSVADAQESDRAKIARASAAATSGA